MYRQKISRLTFTAVGIMVATVLPFGSAVGAGMPAHRAASAIASGTMTAAEAAAGISVAASCSSDPKQNGVEELTATAVRAVPSHGTSTIELWYSPTCRYVWAIEVGGLNGDDFWIYNQNTGAISRGTYPMTATGAINDAGTTSHACMQNNATTFPPAMAKTCTGYF